jgi:hypothetical protein
MRRLLKRLVPPLIFDFYLKLRYRPKRFDRISTKAIKNFIPKFEVLDFKLIDTSYKYDHKWSWWSRIYEYELVLDKLKELNCSEKSLIHNTCWGYEGCHILFKTELESRYSHIVNSDIQSSLIANTVVHDLKSPCPVEWNEKFDFVLNVSTIEEIDYSHIEIFENLLRMVKIKGYLIVTFDLPGIQLDMFESLFSKKIKTTNNPVTGISSAYRMDKFDFLKVGYFVVQRI